MRSPPSTPRNRQGGVILILALIILAVMTLVGMAMSTDRYIATLQSGNVVMVSDQNNKANLCVRRAISWMSDSASGLSPAATTDLPAFNFFAAQFSPAAQNAQYGLPARLVSSSDSAWMGSAPDIVTSDGTRVNCVIERMCQASGPAQPAFCQMAKPGQPDTSAGNQDPTITGYPLMRVSVRVNGVRGVTYLQVTLAPISS